MMLNLKDIDELDFCFYYDSKRHRYRISINYGEKCINVTRKEGETILAFLKILKDSLRVEEIFEPLEANQRYIIGP